MATVWVGWLPLTTFGAVVGSSWIKVLAGVSPSKKVRSVY